MLRHKGMPAMNRSYLDFWVFISKAMALITAVSAVIVIAVFGTMEVPGISIYSPPRTALNWAVILGSAASAIYGILFAALMSATRYGCYFAQDAAATKIPGGHDDNALHTNDWLVEIVCLEDGERERILSKMPCPAEPISSSDDVIYLGPFPTPTEAATALLKLKRETGKSGKIIR